MTKRNINQVEPHIDFSWTDIGVGIRLFETHEICAHKLCLDIQIVWVNIWVHFIKRNI